MPWHSYLIAAFIVGATVYIVAENNSNAGWVYILILLLGISLLWPNFESELSQLAGNLAPLPSRPPGSTTGPY